MASTHKAKISLITVASKNRTEPIRNGSARMVLSNDCLDWSTHPNNCSGYRQPKHGAPSIGQVSP